MSKMPARIVVDNICPLDLFEILYTMRFSGKLKVLCGNPRMAFYEFLKYKPRRRFRDIIYDVMNNHRCMVHHWCESTNSGIFSFFELYDKNISITFTDHPIKESDEAHAFLIVKDCEFSPKGSCKPGRFKRKEQVLIKALGKK